MGVCRLGRRDQFVFGSLGLRVADVLGEAGREEHRVLRHDRELTSEVLQLEVAEVDAVEPDLTLRRVVEPREQIDQRALAGAGRARDAEARAECDVEGDVMQDRTIVAVGERDVTEGDGPAGAGERPGIRSLFDIRWLVEQREGALGAGQMELQARGLLADGPERLIELGEVAHHHEQLAQGEHAGPDVADADQEHGPCADGRRQPDQELVAAFEARHAHPCAHAVLGAALEALLFPRLLTEHLDDPQRAQDLLHDRLGGALELLHLSPLAAQAPPKHTRDENGARRDREGDQGQ